MSSVIITVVVVLGIIVAGGFLLYFMGDLFMSLSHKKKDENTIAKRQEEQNKALEERINALEKADEIKKDPEIATILYNGAVVEDYNPDEEKEEEQEATEEVSEEEETEEPETSEEPTEETNEETSEETEEEDDTTEFIRQRRMELMERLARMQAQEEEEPTEEEDAVDLTDSNEEETTEETTEETEEPEETPEEPEAEETTETTEETTEESEEEEPKTEDADKVAVYEEAKGDVNALASAMTLDELEAKLAEEQEKLKANEKELRKCKKEFIPLRRVKRTLESDEKKLRRKEALVAKQKVVLYGVNNYADIDEEKAKKLEEDLDLLEGLKLSVQHCEEVMEKNSERYPLLEQIFNLLTSQNAQIKEDIKNLQEAIDSLKSDDDADDTADAE